MWAEILRSTTSHSSHQKAKILGYPTFSDMSMTTKMIGSIDQASKSLSSMVLPCRELAQKDLDELQSFAASQGEPADLELWDLAYWRRRHLHSLDALPDPRGYFQLPHVLDTAQHFFQQLFGLKIREKKKSKVELWHEDCRMYEIHDKNGELLGQFALDAYEREGKKLGAYEECIRPKCEAEGSFPLSAMIFSFQRPSLDAPCLLSVDDVHDLFKKVKKRSVNFHFSHFTTVRLHIPTTRYQSPIFRRFRSKQYRMGRVWDLQCAIKELVGRRGISAEFVKACRLGEADSAAASGSDSEAAESFPAVGCSYTALF